ncbi:MAG: hypothetical protein DRN15_00675 [Thermoprotei archaeon]|nr:MAG: hypothetical protein DRN15_00675 [Thermoprotei archaeon]RLF25694.1 MAG: hypothetical protein DRM97_01010 [Thermoprotei archaeon]
MLLTLVSSIAQAGGVTIDIQLMNIQGEPAVRGVEVKILYPNGTTLATLRPNASGWVTAEVDAGKYIIEVYAHGVLVLSRSLNLTKDTILNLTLPTFTVKLNVRNLDRTPLMRATLFARSNITKVLTPVKGGIALLENVPKGIYRITIKKYNITVYEGVIEVHENMSRELNVTANVKFLVVKATDLKGKPLPYAIVKLFSYDNMTYVTELRTNERGEAYFDEVPVIRYIAKVLYKGVIVGESLADPMIPKVVKINSSVGIVKVVVIDKSTNTTMPGIRVLLSNETYGIKASGVTSFNGTFIISRLPLIAYNLSAQRGDVTFYSRIIKPSRYVNAYELSCTPLPVRVVIVDSKEKLTEAKLALIDLCTEEVNYISVGRGSTTLRLYPGSYLMLVYDESLGYAVLLRRMKLIVTRESEVKISCPKSLKLSLRILTADGSPIPGAMVRLYYLVEGRRLLISASKADPSGSVKFDNLIGGDYLVEVIYENTTVHVTHLYLLTDKDVEVRVAAITKLMGRLIPMSQVKLIEFIAYIALTIIIIAVPILLRKRIMTISRGLKHVSRRA